MAIKSADVLRELILGLLAVGLAVGGAFVAVYLFPLLSLGVVIGAGAACGLSLGLALGGGIRYFIDSDRDVVAAVSLLSGSLGVGAGVGVLIGAFLLPGIGPIVGAIVGATIAYIAANVFTGIFAAIGYAAALSNQQRTEANKAFFYIGSAVSVIAGSVLGAAALTTIWPGLVAGLGIVAISAGPLGIAMGAAVGIALPLFILTMAWVGPRLYQKFKSPYSIYTETDGSCIISPTPNSPNIPKDASDSHNKHRNGKEIFVKGKEGNEEKKRRRYCSFPG